MASPFTVFRKNQKVMIAVLGVLAMFAFVFIPIIMEGMGTHTVHNPVVVKTKQFGNLHEFDLRNLQNQRHKVLGVLVDVMQMAGAPPMLARQFLESRLGGASEESVVNGWLLARHSAQLGMVVTDEMVNNFLRDVTQNTVKPGNIQMAFRRASISEFQFFSAMRDVLAAMQLEGMFRVSLLGITPAERWEYFSRVKRMAAIEAVPVPVANYLNRIDDPSDEELKAFFEEHKERVPMPDSPEPGFREPQQVAIEYLRAEVDKFAAAVSDDEIKQRYEKNKELYEPAEKKKEEKTTTQGTKEKEAVKPEPANKDAKEPEKKKDSQKTSAAGRRSPFMLTAMLKDEKPAEKKADEKKEKKEAKTTSKDAKGAKEAAKPKEEPKNAKPAKDVKEPAKDVKTPAKVEKSKPGMAEATKNRIRREIAYEKLQNALEKVREQMEHYRDKYQQYKVKSIQSGGKDKSIGPAPKGPDFDKLAKEFGLSAGRTPLFSQWQMQASDIGGSLVGGRDPVWSYTFQGLAEFRPDLSANLKGDVYLFWKTGETKDRVPKFDDPGVRDRVLREWKMIRARKLAMAAAESLAAEATKAEKPLKKLFADRPDMRVILPPPFSWMTFGNVPLGSAPNAARRSVVTGVDAAGDEFMQTVFRLNPGEVAAALNSPKTTAYVIRLTEFSPSHSVLWKQFEVDDFSKYAPVASNDQQQIVREWLEEIKKTSGFEWIRKPEHPAAAGPGPMGEE